LGAFLGLRQLLAIGGLMILLPVLPLVRMVKETAPVTIRKQLSIRLAIRSTDPRTRLAIGVLVLSQALVQGAYFSATQLAAVRIVQLQGQHAAIATGLAFTAIGLAASAAALGYSFIAGRIALRVIGVAAAVLLAGTVLAISNVHDLLFLVPAIGGIGFAYGALTPALASMIGLEAPALIKATVFGVSGSAGALGMALGPPGAGVVAAFYGVPAGLETAALASLLIAVLLAVWGREPRKT
jgi:MFS family permease